MKLEPGKEVLLSGTSGKDTFIYETVVRSVSSYALEVAAPGEEEGDLCREGMHFLVILRDEEEGHLFFDTFCIGENLSGSRSLTLLFPSEFLRLPVRHSLRAIVTVPVEVAPSGGGGRSFRTRSVNLSTGGVLVTSPHHLEEGSRVTMKIHLPGENKTLTVLARLKRSEESRERGGNLFLQAYEFTDIREESRRKVEAFVRESLVKYIPRKGDGGAEGE